MPSGSIGSHRAFMGVSITFSVCLALVLAVGWRWYFEEVNKRNTLISMAQKAESRARGLENLGLTVESAKTLEDPKPTVSPAPSVSLTEATPTVTTPAASGVLHPEASVIRELPLMETGDDVTQALALLEQYWKTPAWKDRVPMVRDGGRVSALMKDYYEVQGGADPQPGAMSGKARYMIDGTEILYFSFSSNRPTSSLEVAMLRGPEGKFLVDWESLIGYSEMSFLEFRTRKPIKPVMLRAYVRQFDYYNFEFSDATKYLCVKLSSENGESSIYAYAQRGTELARWLETDLATTGPNGYKGYTLQVSFPPDAQSNQCVILDKVTNSRWLTLP